MRGKFADNGSERLGSFGGVATHGGGLELSSVVHLPSSLKQSQPRDFMYLMAISWKRLLSTYITTVSAESTIAANSQQERLASSRSARSVSHSLHIAASSARTSRRVLPLVSLGMDSRQTRASRLERVARRPSVTIKFLRINQFTAAEQVWCVKP
jgi:hypothetical protein